MSIVKPNTDQQLDAIRPLSNAEYQKFRHELQDGDLLFASGNYTFSRSIRQVTASVWSHVALIVRMHERVLVLESIELVGVRLAPLSKYLSNYDKKQPYDGRLVIARRRDMTPWAAQQAVSYGLDELTRPYHHDEVIQIVYRSLLKQKREATPDAEQGYLCSELIYAALQHAGLPVHADEYGFISPQNLWEREEVELLARLL